jgi:hypothetical protein
MTKDERNEFQRQGKLILRAKYFKNCWYMVEYTERGGWSIFRRTRFETREACEKLIDEMAESHRIVIHDK